LITFIRDYSCIIEEFKKIWKLNRITIILYYKNKKKVTEEGDIMKKGIALILICAICALSVGFCLTGVDKRIADEQPPIIYIYKG
jgi:hypothetical protein